MPSLAQNARLVAHLLRHHPHDFSDRALDFLHRASGRIAARVGRGRADSYESQPHTLASTLTWEAGLNLLQQSFGADPRALLQEPALLQLEQHLTAQISTLSTAQAESPIPLNFNADFSLGRFCYLVCRLLKPTTVLETGVAYGATAAFILTALQENGAGGLHSIDLPPLAHDVDRYVGYLVPHHLKTHWTFHRRSSRRLLPSLLPQLGPVDLFLHDSRHTYIHTLFELDTITPHLSPRAAVIVDDADSSAAWQEWTKTTKAAKVAAIREERKAAYFGFALLDNPS